MTEKMIPLYFKMEPELYNKLREDAFVKRMSLAERNRVALRKDLGMEEKSEK